MLWVSGWLLWPVILVSFIFVLIRSIPTLTNQRKMEMTMIKIASGETFSH